MKNFKQRIENLIPEVNQYLLNNFGLIPQETKIKLYQTVDISKFTQKSFYISSEREAYLLISDELDPTFAFLHEYFGHGLFCEYSIPGINIVNKSKSYKNSSINQTKQELDSFFIKTEHIYEGFALWLEKLIANYIGKNYTAREEEIKSLNLNFPNSKFKTYYDALKKFNNLENDLGQYNAFLESGFPIVNNSFLINGVKQRLRCNNEELIYLVYYGSKKSYSDADLLAVTKNMNIQGYQWGLRLDILQMDINDFLTRSELLDPSLTEPFLTGDLIFGNKQEYVNLINKIKEKKGDEKTLDFLLERNKKIEEAIKKSHSEDELKNNQDFLNENQLFIEWYKLNNRPIEVKELLQK